MLCGEIITVCSEMPARHTNSFCGQKVEFLILDVVVHTIATRL